tara:strand:+ start:123 stop:431 length:309 start_codon:yes stop_codon:yes gene_type:complete
MFGKVRKGESVFKAFSTLSSMLFQLQRAIQSIYHEFAPNVFQVLHSKIIKRACSQEILLPYQSDPQNDLYSILGTWREESDQAIGSDIVCRINGTWTDFTYD